MSESSLLKAIFDTQLIGISRFILGVPVEHYFDRLKTYCQSQLKEESLLKATRNIIREHGIKHGIFAGFSPNLVLQLMKQQYRWPMMILVPPFIKDRIPNTVQRFPRAHKVLTGITLGLFEACVICPLELLKCNLMTRSQLQSRNFKFIQYCLVKSEILSIRSQGSIFGGLQLCIMKQTTSWVQYLYCDHVFRHHFKKDNPKQALTISQIIACSYLSAVCNIIVVSPFDTLKTLYQMKNTTYQVQSVSQSFWSLYKSKGLRGIYCGWQIRLASFTLQSLLTTPVIDYLERVYG